jgi:hypothetical protein
MADGLWTLGRVLVVAGDLGPAGFLIWQVGLSAVVSIVGTEMAGMKSATHLAQHQDGSLFPSLFPDPDSGPLSSTRSAPRGGGVAATPLPPSASAAEVAAAIREESGKLKLLLERARTVGAAAATDCIPLMSQSALVSRDGSNQPPDLDPWVEGGWTSDGVGVLMGMCSKSGRPPSMRSRRCSRRRSEGGYRGV